jgi:hypothetical protein
MYGPQDEAPRSTEQKPRGSKRRRLAVILIPALVMLIAGFLIGHFTASKGSMVPVAAATASASPIVVATTPSTLADSPPITPSPSLSSSASPATSATGGSSAGSTSDASPADTLLPEYLSQATAVDDDSALTSPADVTISGTEYPNSIQQGVEGGDGTTTVWDSAQYETFTAEVGIDDSQPADGQTARIVFLNESSVQLGSVQVSIGAPTHVSIALKGAVHFEIQCISEQSDGGYVVTFGNAQFLP